MNLASLNTRRSTSEKVRGRARAAQHLPYVPMPPQPTVVDVPLFEDLRQALNENRQTTLTSIEEQRRSIRDMKRLQQELERSIQDRRFEIHRLVDEVDEMRDALHELGTTTGFYGTHAGPNNASVPAPPGPIRPPAPQARPWSSQQFSHATTSGWSFISADEAYEGTDTQTPLYQVDSSYLPPGFIPDHIVPRNELQSPPDSISQTHWRD